MKKIYLSVVLVLLGVIIGLYLRDHLPAKPAAAKVVTISSRNLTYPVLTTAATVGEALKEQNFATNEALVSPANAALLTSGMTIAVLRPVTLTLVDGGQARTITTRAATVGDFLDEQKIGLAATDRVSPDLANYVGEGMTITIDRIVDVSVTETVAIPYATKLQYDPTSYYGQQTVLSPGHPGQKIQNFLITYKNGAEIKRKLLSEQILTKPVTESRSFGTKIAVIGTADGRASWYRYQNCMCAAHPQYAAGRFVRVTDLDSGKSLIVQINDQGPNQNVYPDRIIDLDAVAFLQLAPLSAGTISVRVELLQD